MDADTENLGAGKSDLPAFGLLCRLHHLCFCFNREDDNASKDGRKRSFVLRSSMKGRRAHSAVGALNAVEFL